MEPLPGNFPARNRIVTGLSRGCIVVQAAQKSGALISAHYAMEQGREVFAIPGAIGDELSAGCNQIIQEGAKLVMSSADILNEFGDRVIIPVTKIAQQQVLFADASNPSILFEDKKLPTSRKASSGTQGERKRKIAAIYSESQQKIITACKQPASIEDIVSATQLSFEQVQSELFNLQLDGVVFQDFTGMWAVH